MIEGLILGRLATSGDLTTTQNGENWTVRYRGMSMCDVIAPDGSRQTFRYLSDARAHLASKGIDTGNGWKSR